MKIEEKIAKKLINSKKSLAIAESCTGGLVSNRLTNISGSSSFLKVGVVTYSNESKIKLLKVNSHFIKKYGAVSKHVAIQMSEGVRKIFKTDFGIGISGIAGPTGGTKQKPVGLVYISVSSKYKTICIECKFKGNRIKVKTQAATKALKQLSNFFLI